MRVKKNKNLIMDLFAVLCQELTKFKLPCRLQTPHIRTFTEIDLFNLFLQLTKVTNKHRL